MRCQVRDVLLTMGVFPLLYNQINDATSPAMLHKLT